MGELSEVKWWTLESSLTVVLGAIGRAEVWLWPDEDRYEGAGPDELATIIERGLAELDPMGTYFLIHPVVLTDRGREVLADA
jgi:hypothetical protein